MYIYIYIHTIKSASGPRLGLKQRSLVDRSFVSADVNMWKGPKCGPLVDSMAYVCNVCNVCNVCMKCMYVCNVCMCVRTSVIHVFTCFAGPSLSCFGFHGGALSGRLGAAEFLLLVS